MQERERTVIGGLVVLLLVLWLGFLVHRSPRFPGSAWGGALAVSGALLLLWPLGYALLKRVPVVKAAVTKRISMHTLLAWHVYTGTLGALLALLHTGHKFESVLGFLLTAMMFAAVLSGYVGRHLLRLVGQELQEKEATLATLQAAYRQTEAELAQHPAPVLAAVPRGFLGRLAAAFFTQEAEVGTDAPALASRAVRLAGSIADMEYAIEAHERLQRWFKGWLALHIATSLAFYVLLALHVWTGIYFGLRWFQ